MIGKFLGILDLTVAGILLTHQVLPDSLLHKALGLLIAKGLIFTFLFKDWLLSPIDVMVGLLMVVLIGMSWSWPFGFTVSVVYLIAKGLWSVLA